ncbi:MAG: hypothetical protein ACR2HN_02030 [Tepidiformaceae bacterium]
MMRVLKGEVDDDGRIRVLESVRLECGTTVVVTIDDGDDDLMAADLVILSAPALAKDWSNPEEDDAWSHLQLAQ